MRNKLKFNDPDPAVMQLPSAAETDIIESAAKIAKAVFDDVDYITPGLIGMHKGYAPSKVGVTLNRYLGIAKARPGYHVDDILAGYAGYRERYGLDRENG